MCKVSWTLHYAPPINAHRGQVRGILHHQYGSSPGWYPLASYIVSCARLHAFVLLFLTPSAPGCHALLACKAMRLGNIGLVPE